MSYCSQWGFPELGQKTAWTLPAHEPGPRPQSQVKLAAPGTKSIIDFELGRQDFL